jgi:hypothetical protein
MKCALILIVAATMPVLSVAAPAAAGQLEDAHDAYDRGEYATALRLLRPKAQR